MTTTGNLRIFYTGATGYIGGSVLKRILTGYPKAHVTALVRAQKDIDVLKSIGVHEVITGSLADLDVLRKNASLSDFVFQCANADDPNVMKAIIEGLKERHQATGIRPVLFHTSGAGLFMDRSPGSITEEAKAHPWDDLDEKRLAGLQTEAVQRGTDEMIVKADSEGYIDGYIICPPIVYGKSTGPILPVRESVHLPGLVKASKLAGAAWYVGEGTAAWSNVHIDDLVDLYVVVIGHALKPETRAQKATPWSRYFFAENGQCSWAELAGIIASTLHSIGAIENDAPISIPFTKAQEMFGPLAWGVCSNSISVANRGRQLGWSPKHSDWKPVVRSDVERIAKSLTSAA